jgi:tRNA nucleotidyltransferase (CCA-adding enzyme)
MQNGPSQNLTHETEAHFADVRNDLINEGHFEHHDFQDPEYQHEAFETLDARIRNAAGLLATRIKALPHDPQRPELVPRALIVGGFVRDTLLQKKPKDADIEVYGVDAGRLENLLDQLFPEQVLKTGKAFSVLKVNLGDGLDLDVSIPRRDSKMPDNDEVSDDKNFIINGDPSMTIEEAARRRDFSFNAMAMDPLTGEVFDPFGGTEDLEKRQIRVTDEILFPEDALRVYRAVQFAARMNLTVEPKSFQFMKEMVDKDRLDRLKKERVLVELDKLLTKSEKPSVGFELARELGIIKKYYPEVHALIDLPQEKEWHPEGDVWIHTLMVVDEAAKIIHREGSNFTKEEQMQIMMGALCHDLGKATTTEEIDGKIRSRGHEEAGVEPTEIMLERLKFGKKVIEGAKVGAAQHLKPGTLFREFQKGVLDEKKYKNAVRKLLKRTHPISWKVLLAIAEADHRGRDIPGVATAPYEAGEFFAKMITENTLDVEPTKELIQGRDVIATAKKLGKNLKPGKIFGELIHKVEEMRDNGDVATYDEAMVELEMLMKELS